MRKWPTKVERIVDKIWGKEFWIVNNDKYCLKFLYIEPGKMCSLHYHPIKDETFYIEEGVCNLQIGDRVTVMEPGDSVRLMPEMPHRFWVQKNAEEGCMVIEVSTHHEDSDVVRLEESRVL